MSTRADIILNEYGRIYHLDMHPDDLGEIIITVGDPQRVPLVSRHLEEITTKRRHREFHSHSGYLFGKTITVLSTGIGSPNIDIVINELHLLANYDFKERNWQQDHRTLKILRLGTSGSLQKQITAGEVLWSGGALGYDGLPYWYKADYEDVPERWSAIAPHLPERFRPLLYYSTPTWTDLQSKLNFISGTTLTCPGFYGPQGRDINPRYSPAEPDFLNNMMNVGIANLEMETAAIFSLSEIFGHKAASINAILANRATGEFHNKPLNVINKMIEIVIDQIKDL